MTKHKEIKTYVIVNEDKTESGAFTGKAPRTAALKAIKTLTGTIEKPITIKLRERGTKKLHVFTGYTEIVNAPATRPKWMPEKIRQAFVQKAGIEGVEK